MEVIGEDLQVQVFALSHNAPNQEVSLLNEDVAIATEVVTEKPELVEIEKELVFQKRFIMKEKILLPKKVNTFPLNHVLGGHSSLFTVGDNGLAEVSNHDCEESSKMEMASQESTDSRMDISSQESSLSQMEYSSQEADILINPISNNCIQSKEKVDDREATCEAKPFKGNGIPVNEAQVLLTEVPSYEKCSWHENDPQISEGSVPNGEVEEVLKENRFQSEVFEAGSEAESGALKRKAADILADEMKLRTDLLSREEAVSARETACLSREKAIKEREAALVSQGNSFLMAAANDSPSSKRFKSIDAFKR